MATTFPAGFLWGTATAAYQVEGAVTADGRGPSIWDVFSHTPGKTWHGDTGDIADEQYYRFESDFDLMAELGLQAYRFSVSWPRIQPTGQGAPNQAGLDHYRRVVEALRQRNIVPMLTLYHWDLPQALQDRGGWTNRETAERFAEYAAIVYRALADVVPYWITLNEPQVSSFAGYGTGEHAPGVKSEVAALEAAHTLLLAHGLALQAMRGQQRPNTQLGITLNLSPIHPASDSPADVAAARRVDANRNRLFLDPIFRGQYPGETLQYYQPLTDFAFMSPQDLEIIAAPIDFLGVNYYMVHTVQADPQDPARIAHILPPEGDMTAMNWGITPEGLTELLVRLHNEYTPAPLYITENGAAFYDYVDPEHTVDDVERVAYLDGHFRAAHRAIEQGVNLRGYFVWSYLDNFEWAYGYSKRFGIVYVDYDTQKRIPKQSAYWYRDVIERNGLAEPIDSASINPPLVPERRRRG